MIDVQPEVTVKHSDLPVAEVDNGRRFVTMAEAFVVDFGNYDMAAERASLFATDADRLDRIRDSFVRPLNDTVKRFNDWFRGPIADRKQAAQIMKTKMLAFTQEQQRQAEEERRKHEAAVREAQRKAEAEARAAREKADAEARRQREVEIAAKEAADRAAAEVREAQARGDREAAKVAQEARIAAEEAERKAREKAMAATAKGEEKAAEAQQKGMVAMSTPVATTATPEAKGVAKRVTWHFEPVDFLTFVKAVAEGKAPSAWLKFDEEQLRKAAPAIKDTMTYPGIRFVPREAITVRSR